MKDPLEGKVGVHPDPHTAARTGNLHAGLEVSAETILTENPTLVTNIIRISPATFFSTPARTAVKRRRDGVAMTDEASCVRVVSSHS